MIETQQYPIGRFIAPTQSKESNRQAWIATIASFASNLEDMTINLTESQLDTPYRKGGWTVRQVVHHCADSHMNAFIRFKLSLTEEQPTIKPYAEAHWAELPDSKMEIGPSLDIVKGVHARWTMLLRHMTELEFCLEYIHPEHGSTFRLDQVLANYDWHCRHHLAHIQMAINS